MRSAFAALLTLALALPAAAQATPPGRDGLLAVVVGDRPTRDGQSIVLLTAEGAVAGRVARPAAYGDLWPAWSPDGRSLAFSARVGAAEMRLAVADADGTHRRTLPRPAPFVDAVAPAWSPGGTRLAFSAVGFDVGGIWTVDRQGRGVRRVSPFGSLPSWGSGGRFAVGDGGIAVWTMRTDGSGLRRLTTWRSDDPDWSPGATRIAYTRFAHGREEVWTMRADGGDKRRVAAGAMPAWSPDGRRIAYVRSGRLFLAPWRGGTESKVPYAPSTAAGRRLPLSMPAWQPLP